MAKAKSRKPVKKRSAGPLLIMAVLFFSSGAVRVAANLNATETDPITEPSPEQPPEQCLQQEGVEKLMGYIRERQERLVVQDRQISDRMAVLQVAEQELQRTLQMVEAAEAKLQSSLAFASRAMNEDLASLIAVYESMKPKEAASLFAAMPPEFAAGCLAQMRSEIAAQIMAGLTPDQAYGISVFIAGRNAGLNDSVSVQQ